ncbi:hypothetical protein [Emticicia sp. C21]|uniref:hypothetical protein n=1 Tax=Emticicia sp. C21 TaxID=2302915 RepID=UPI000E34C109|nr:hypothetical protein [Emticicia sp. C21]RFS17094.1 hypothetical protein D0T08_10495 [Emticicia sp. C21]
MKRISVTCFLLLSIISFSSFSQATTITAGSAGTLQFPALSYTQILAIPSPQPGMAAYDNTSNCLRIFNGICWPCSFQNSAQIAGISGLGGTDSDKGTKIAVNSVGEIIVTGIFQGTMGKGANTITSNGFTDIFIAKYSKIGDLIWLKKAGGSSFELSTGITTDNANNIYITGLMAETAYFGNSSVTSNGAADFFLAKYDTNGDLIWVKNGGGATDDGGIGNFKVDANGNIFVSGYITGTASFDAFSLTSQGGYDTFLAKYKSDGSVEWIKQGGGTNWDISNGTSIDSNGNIYITGTFKGTASFDTFSLTSSGFDDIFIVKYSPAGAVLWAKKAGGIEFDTPHEITVDNSNNILITGAFQNTADFSGTNLTATNISDVFIAKYDANGNLLWAKKAGGADNDVSYGMAVNNIGEIFIVGNFNGTATFSPVTVSVSTTTTFIAKCDANGNFKWVQKIGGADINSSYSYGITTDNSRNVYATGKFKGTVNFFSSKITSAGQEDVFIARITEDCN